LQQRFSLVEIEDTGALVPPDLKPKIGGLHSIGAE
jgi:hypothetical protein